MPIAALGLVAAAVGVTCSVPQVWRLRRSPHADGMSHASAVLAALSSATWLAYGLSVLDPPQILANIPGLAGASAVLALVLRRSSRSATPALAAGAGWAGLVGGAGLVGHAPAIGAAATAVSLVSRVPQLRQVFRSASITAVSPASFALSCTSSSLWAGYGLGTHDAPVWVCSSAVLVLSVLILGRCLLAAGPGRAAIRPVADGMGDWVAWRAPQSTSAGC